MPLNVSMYTIFNTTNYVTESQKAKEPTKLYNIRLVGAGVVTAISSYKIKARDSNDKDVISGHRKDSLRFCKSTKFIMMIGRWEKGAGKRKPTFIDSRVAKPPKSAEP